MENQTGAKKFISILSLIIVGASAGTHVLAENPPTGSQDQPCVNAPSGVDPLSGQPLPGVTAAEQVLNGSTGNVDEVLENEKTKASFALRFKGKKSEAIKFNKTLTLFKRILKDPKQARAIFPNQKNMWDPKKSDLRENLQVLLTPVDFAAGDLQAGGAVIVNDGKTSESEQLKFETSNHTEVHFMASQSPFGAEIIFTNVMYPDPDNKSKLSPFDITIQFKQAADGSTVSNMFIINKNIFSDAEPSQLLNTPCDNWESKMAEILKNKNPLPEGLHGLCKTHIAKEGMDDKDSFYAQKGLDFSQAQPSQIGTLPFKFSGKAIGKKKMNATTGGEMVDSAEISDLKIEFEGREYSAEGEKISSQRDESGSLLLKNLDLRATSDRGGASKLQIHELKLNPKGKTSVMLEIQKRPKSMTEDPLIIYAYARLLAKERRDARRDAFSITSYERDLLKKISEILVTGKNQELTNLDWIYIRKYAYDVFNELHTKYHVANDTQIELLQYLENKRSEDKAEERRLESRWVEKGVVYVPYNPQYNSEKTSISFNDFEAATIGSLQILNRTAFTTDMITASHVKQTEKDGKTTTHFTQAKLSRLSPANRLPFGVASVVAEIIPGLKDIMGREKVTNYLTVELNSGPRKEDPKGEPLNGLSFQGSLGDFFGNLAGTFEGKDYNYRPFSKLLLQSEGRFEIKTGVSHENFEKTQLFESGQKFQTSSDLTKKLNAIEAYKSRGEENLTDAYIETKMDAKKGHADINLDHMRDGIEGVILRSLYSNPKAVIRTLAGAAMPTGTAFFIMDGEGFLDGAKQFGDKAKIEEAIKNETNVLNQKPLGPLVDYHIAESELEEFMELRQCKSLDFKDNLCVINTRQGIGSITFQQISNKPCRLGDSLQFREGPPAAVFVSKGCQVDLKIKVKKSDRVIVTPSGLTEVSPDEQIYVSAGKRSGEGEVKINNHRQVLEFKFRPSDRKFNWCTEGRDYGFDRKKGIFSVKNHCEGYFDVTYVSSKRPGVELSTSESTSPQKRPAARRAGRGE